MFIVHCFNLNKLCRFCCANNQLKSLPLSLGLLISLKTLDISRNNITLLPNEISQLHNLKHLDISGNKITNLPYSMGDGCLKLG